MLVQCKIDFEIFKEEVEASLKDKGREATHEYKIFVAQTAEAFKKARWSARADGGQDERWREWFRDFEPCFTQTAWTNFRNISADNINKLKNRSGSKTDYAIGLHYRFLAELDEDEIKAAEELDAFVFGTRAKSVLGEIFEISNTPQPGLTLTPASASRFHFTKRSIEVLGRTEEEAKLDAFLTSDTGFWMQLAGSAGQGKSRLAFELAHRAEKTGWQAGFLEGDARAAFKDQWQGWKPEKPTLIIVDYVIGGEALLQPMMAACLKLAQSDGHAVRVLLLERQPFDRAFKRPEQNQTRKGAGVAGDLLQSMELSETADWFFKLCGDSRKGAAPFLKHAHHPRILELKTLELSDLTRIVKASAGDTLTTSDKDIEDHLHRIDPTGAPLFAYFLGQALAAPDGNKHWTRTDLLRSTINRDREDRWQHHLGAEEMPQGFEDSPAMRMALIATMCKGIRFADLVEAGVEGAAAYEQRKKALVLADGEIPAQFDTPASVIPPLEPDILGEFFVLSAVEDGIEINALIEIALHTRPEEFIGFLVRIVQNFAANRVTTKIVERVYQGAGSNQSVVSAVSDIIVAYHDISIAPRKKRDQNLQSSGGCRQP